MPRTKLDEELKNLRDGLKEMNNLVCRDIHDAVNALKNGDTVLAESVVREDKRIDGLYSELKEKSIQTIALHQPVAKDLRYISITIDVVYNLERIADYADDIALIVEFVKDEDVDLEFIDEMSGVAIEITEKATNAYVNLDTSKHDEIKELEDRMDELFSRTFPILKKLVRENRETSIYAMNMVLVAKYLERIADHAMNIDNRIQYAVKGKPKYL